MTRVAVAYAATAIVFCGLDFLWFGYVAKDYYQSQIGALLLEKPNLPAAALFYALPAVTGGLCRHWYTAITLATLPAWVALGVFATLAAPRLHRRRRRTAGPVRRRQLGNGR